MKKNILKIVLSLVAIVLLMLGFQNCSQRSVESSSHNEKLDNKLIPEPSPGYASSVSTVPSASNRVVTRGPTYADGTYLTVSHPLTVRANESITVDVEVHNTPYDHGSFYVNGICNFGESRNYPGNPKKFQCVLPASYAWNSNFNSITARYAAKYNRNDLYTVNSKIFFNSAPNEYENIVNKLIEIYNLTDGDHWSKNTGWKDSSGNFNTSDVCSWYGISCGCKAYAIGPTSSFVCDYNFQNLNLSNNNLSGSFPADISMLPFEMIYLNGNNISGPFPLLPSSVQILYLQQNQFSGNIKSLPPSLYYFQAFSNKLTGPLPSLPETLHTLTISYNNLTGTLPRFPESLEHLDIANNHLTGNLPVAWPQNLKYLNISSNELTGTLPPPPASLTLANICFPPEQNQFNPIANTTWDRLTERDSWHQFCKTTPSTTTNPLPRPLLFLSRQPSSWEHNYVFNSETDNLYMKVSPATQSTKACIGHSPNTYKSSCDSEYVGFLPEDWDFKTEGNESFYVYKKNTLKNHPYLVKGNYYLCLKKDMNETNPSCVTFVIQ